MSSSSSSSSSSQQTHRTWIKKQQVPLGCSILQIFVAPNDVITINQPLFEYKVFNVEHAGTVGDRTGVFLTSIYKNVKNDTLCKARVVSVFPTTLPLSVKTEADRVILHIEYIDESVAETSTPASFEPSIPTYTLL